jgi:potassium channel subfamily K, other eukaryote
MHIYAAPLAPYEIYSQGFWYAVIAALLYFFSCSVLMLNMWGYFLGHYPQRFELNEHQRTLILQTMLFFVWLAAGGGIFSSIETLDNGHSWGFVDGLYFCDVTILTVGFGDLTPGNDLGRGLVFPYSVGGIIMLGLVISSISKFAQEIAGENVVRKHVEKQRVRTVERTTADPLELERYEILGGFRGTHVGPISAPFNARRFGHRSGRQSGGTQDRPSHTTDRTHSMGSRRSSVIPVVHKRLTMSERLKLRHKKITLLKEEEQRFDEMRKIQKETERFKRYWALALSVVAFLLLWCVGAIVFWQVEQSVQDMTYFQALYFCYISLLTIGYGDFAPQSNPGRAFFVVWSLVAVPTMTLLISDMSSTVIETFKSMTTRVADYSVLLKKDAFKSILDDHPRLKHWIEDWQEERARKKRLKSGMQVGDAPSTPDQQGSVNEELGLSPIDVGNDNSSSPTEKKSNGLRHVTTNGSRYIADDGRHLHIGDTPGGQSLLRSKSIENLAKQIDKDENNRGINEAKLARRLATAIRAVACDVKETGNHEIRYTFEQWAELTRLIRFTSEPQAQAIEEESNDVLEWDWLGEDSPMMTGLSEPEYVLDRLCESLVRYTRRVERRVESGFARGKRQSIVLTGTSDKDEVLRNQADDD